MPHNLVLLSLDGVSQTMFWQYREAMPVLWDLSLGATAFRRFHTSSVSALQSFCDLSHGDAAEMDHFSDIPDSSDRLAGNAGNLFDLLHRRGFAVQGHQHANPVSGSATDDPGTVWPSSCGEFHRHSDYQIFFSETASFLERARSASTPFVLYYSDQAARPDDASPEKDETPLYHERFEKGFSLLDHSAGRLMETLSGLDLLDNTIIAVFGPYGMDPYRHGIYRGRTIGILPYADLAWTPLMLRYPGNEAITTDQLVSLMDLKPTLLHMLFPDEEQPEAHNALSGIDILRYGRRIAFTQNMSALQREGEGAARGLAKSYAATDGDMRLMVTSNGGIPGEGGLELYFDPRDPGNTRNLLDFFDLDANGAMTAFGRTDIVHVHFTQSFKQQYVMGMVHDYNVMREELYNTIRLKERAAAERLAGVKGGGMTFPDDPFRKKRRWQ